MSAATLGGAAIRITETPSTAAGHGADGSQQGLFPCNDPGQLPIAPLRKRNGEWFEGGATDAGVSSVAARLASEGRAPAIPHTGSSIDRLAAIDDQPLWRLQCGATLSVISYPVKPLAVNFARMHPTNRAQERESARQWR